VLDIVSKWTDLLEAGIIKTNNGVIVELNAAARAMGFEEGKVVRIPKSRILKTEIGECEALIYGEHIILKPIDTFSQMKQFLIDAIAHEILTPITSIGGLLYLVKEGIDVEKNIEKIENHLGKIARIVDELLLLSKVEMGNYVPRSRRVELRGVIQEILKLYADRVERKKLEVKVKARGMMKTDPEALGIIVRNIISNAIKYTDPGGKVTISASNKRIVVEDTGVGIPPKELPFIFQRFFRASNVRDRGGSGLGLAIAKHLAEVLGFEIAIDSRLGVGTRVELKM